MAALILAIGSLFAVAAAAQDAATSSDAQRVAAVRYALAHGFEIPPTGVIVAAEQGYQRGQVRKTSLSPEEQIREAEEIARLIGPAVPIGWAQDHVQCKQSVCYAATTTAVLVVEAAFPSTPGRPHSGGPGIYMKLYFPATGTERAMLQQAVVDTERRGPGWIGIGFSAEPKRFAVR